MTKNTSPSRETFNRAKVIEVISYTTDSGNWHFLARKCAPANTDQVVISGELYSLVTHKLHQWRRSHNWRLTPDTNSLYWTTKTKLPPVYLQTLAMELSNYLKEQS